MKRLFKVFGIVLGSLLALWLLVAVTAQVLLSPKVLQKVITRYEKVLLDGELTFKDLKLSVFDNFPRITVILDSVSLTYPDTLFSPKYEVYSNTIGYLGRGGNVSDRDTLASFSRLEATINISRLVLDKVIDLPYFALHNPRIYFKQYAQEGVTNLDIVKPIKAARLDTNSVEAADTTSLPQIILGQIALLNHPRVVVSAPHLDAYLLAGMKQSVVGNNIVLDDLLAARMNDFDFDIDSLLIQDFYGQNTAVNLLLDRLCLTEQGNLYGISAALHTKMKVPQGYTEVPVELNGSITLPTPGDFSHLDISTLQLNLAELPVLVSGSVDLIDLDNTDIRMNLRAKVDEFHIHDLVKRFEEFLPISASQIGKKAIISLDANISGKYAKNHLPWFDANCVVRNIDVSSPADTISAFVDSLGIKAFHRNASTGDYIAKGMDILGVDVKVDSINLNYKDAAVLRGRKILAQAQMGTDYIFEEKAFQDGGNSILAGGFVSASYLNLKDVDSMSVSLRNTANNFSVVPSITDKTVPIIKFDTSNDRVVALSPKFGRAFLRNVAANVNMEFMRNRKLRPEEAFLDSLAKQYKGVPRDSILLKLRADRPNRTRAVADELKQYNMSFSMGETAKKFFESWEFRGAASIRRIAVNSPFYPLATRVNGVEVGFNNNELELKKFKVVSGHSSLGATGKITGLRGMASGSKNQRIGANLTVVVDSLHTIELINAVTQATEHIGSTISASELENLGDTANGQVATDTVMAVMKAPILPANVEANIHLSGHKVLYDKLRLDTLNLKAKMKNRELKIYDAIVNLPQAKLSASALYVTKSFKDIKAYVDASLLDIDAQGVISLMPGVDTLMPILNSFNGKFAVNAALTAGLDTLMKLVPGSLDGYARVVGNHLNLSDTDDIRSVLRLLRFEDRDNLHMDSVTIEGHLSEQQFELYPCLVSLDRYALGVGGIMQASGAYDFHVSLLKSPIALKAGVDINNQSRRKWKLTKAQYKLDPFPAKTTFVTEKIGSVHKKISSGAK